MSTVGIFLCRSNTRIKILNVQISLIFNTNGHSFNIQTQMTSYSGAHLFFCVICGLRFFYVREETSISIGLRAEEMLSSYGRNTTSKNQFFIVMMTLVAFALLMGFSRS